MSSPSLTSRFVPDEAVTCHQHRITVESLELNSAALLHRDPMAERSRLVTRKYTFGAAKHWYDEHDQVCVRLLLYRFASTKGAEDAAWDMWHELYAARVPMKSFDPPELKEFGIRGLSIGIAEEDGIVHAICAQRIRTFLVTATIRDTDGDQAKLSMNQLIVNQLLTLATVR